MTEQNSTDFSVPQTSGLQAEPEMTNQNLRTASAAVPENPSGDLQVKTPFDYLKEAFQKEVETEPIRLLVPNRPGVAIEFDTNITSEQIDLWRKQSTVSGNRRQRRSGEGDMDQIKFMALVIVAQCQIFTWSGQDVYLDPPANSKPLTFFEKEALKSIMESNALDDTQLVKDVFKNDAHIISVGSQVIEAAGYGDDVEEAQEDPTSR